MASILRSPASLRELAVQVTDATLDAMPEMRDRYGDRGRQFCIDDTIYHLTYLGEAAAIGDTTLFEDYIAWAKVMLSSRGVGAADLTANLTRIAAALDAHSYDPSVASAITIVRQTLDALATMPESIPPTPLGEPAARYLDHVLAGRRRDADAVITERVAAGAALSDIYLGIFEPVQHEIGRLWQTNRISVAQEHFCTAALQRSMTHVYEKLFTGMPGRKRVVAACAGGELHEVGLRMVTDLLEANGWDTVYLGANVPAESVVRTIAEGPTALVAISATMTPNLRALARLIEAIRRHPDTARVPVMVGGYPFRVSASVAERLGADGWAMNASEALRLADKLTAA